MGFAATVDGIEKVAGNIIKFKQGFLREVNKDFKQIQFLVDQTVTKNISLTDEHEGHPYALGGSNPHDPAYQVHKRSGEMLASKQSGTKEADISGGNLTAEAWVGVDESLGYPAAVIWGTSKMIPRNFLFGSVQECKDEIVFILGRSLSQAVITFQGEKVKL